jgi:hypothetical protein
MQKGMSASPLKADMCDATHVRPRAFAVFRLISGAIDTHYDREASVHRFVGPKRIERIAGVYEAGVAAVA